MITLKTDGVDGVLHTENAMFTTFGSHRTLPRLQTLTLICFLAILPGNSLADEKSGDKAADEDAKPDVKLVDGKWEDVQKLVADNKGKVVVVDLWGLSCLPCVKEYPNLVELSKQHPEDVVCVSFNIDYIGLKRKKPEYYRPRVQKFLNEKESSLHNILCVTPSDEIFTDLKLGSIPAVYVYDGKGELVKRFDGDSLEDGEEEAFTYEEDINPLVEELLRKLRKQAAELSDAAADSE